MGTFHYDRVGFNIDAVKKMTLKEFLDHPMHENHYVRLEKAAKRKVLKSVYKHITGIGPEPNKEQRDE
jgi:hypothetical protein